MNKLFDLRFVIGLFFTIIGVLLLVYGFMGKDASGGTVNLLTGGAFGLFGLLMIAFSFGRKES